MFCKQFVDVNMRAMCAKLFSGPVDPVPEFSCCEVNYQCTTGAKLFVRYPVGVGNVLSDLYPQFVAKESNKSSTIMCCWSRWSPVPNASGKPEKARDVRLA